MEQDPSGDEFYKGRLSPASALSFPLSAILTDCLWILGFYESAWDVRVFVHATEPELASYAQRNKDSSGSLAPFPLAQLPTQRRPLGRRQQEGAPLQALLAN